MANGLLDLTARRLAQPYLCNVPGAPYTTQYVSGMVDSYGLFAQAYGRFEVRAKVPSQLAAGLQTALWLYPQNPAYGGWPSSGEIDIAEMFGNYRNLAVPTVHYDNASDPGATNTTCAIDPTRFHTYALVWTTDSLQVTIDGALCLDDRWTPLTMAKPAPFDQPFYLLLTQALGIGTNALTATTPLPATTAIDYVRVWR
ncbi:MAG: glycoside hydrolase family 16 protein [Jatrophihabitans sp.]|uniref:glycoside hydrolase family 16 protein n=1 Tax=Jatrophihabitans sp. TaxID=1932789 RepID=UPI003F8196E0